MPEAEQPSLGTCLQATKATVPEHPDYLDKVSFVELPPEGTKFAPAHHDSHNKGKLDDQGNRLPTEFNMHVDDNLCPGVGIPRMKLAMRHSIHSLNAVAGHPAPELRPNAVDLDKFKHELISHERTQLGITINTRAMTVRLPDSKMEKIADLLTTTWGPQQRSFKVREAAELLGTLISACQVCQRGMFLFISLQHTLGSSL